MRDRRTVLFLQGHPTDFSRAVAHEVERQGGRALRINLCVGDWLLWRRPGGISYRGRLKDWPRFLTDYIRREGVTDIVYYCDRHPYNQVAERVARELGVTAITYEFGYLRPDWITLERGGMSAYSHFPNDPAQIRAIASMVEDADVAERYKYTFLDEAVGEVIYNVVNSLLWFVYPFYDADKYYSPLIEYASYVPLLLSSGRRDRETRALVKQLIATEIPFYVCPMQMQNDYQVRANSGIRHQRDMARLVIESFAEQAPRDSHLVFKIHPLDNGLERWPQVIGRMADGLGISRRVHVVQGGDLKSMLKAARGAVMINSTVGVHAIRHGCPVKVLGIAIYDVAGLTHQGPLETFWGSPERPDPALVADFVKALAGTIQIKGNFFNAEGRARAIPEIARRILAGRVNEPGGYVAVPPRLARARADGVHGADAYAATLTGVADPEARGTGTAS